MIFNVPEHIDMIRNGIKTQTRRAKRGYYKLESERKNPHEVGYAVQRKRGAKGEPDIRIVMDKIGEATIEPPFNIGVDNFPSAISEADAWAEGGYTPFEFEEIFQKLNPKWDGKVRWIFVFHVIKVQR